jgi:hypothetical protein
MAKDSDGHGRSKAEKRKSFRFPIPAIVEAKDGAALRAAGELLNLSRDGAAIRCASPLELGASYVFHFEGVGAWRGEVVRAFENGGYAVVFDNTDREKLQIDRILMDIFDNRSERGVITPARAGVRTG